MTRVLLVSYRLPVTFRADKGRLVASVSAGGLANGLEASPRFRLARLALGGLAGRHRPPCPALRAEADKHLADSIASSPSS